MSAFAALPLLPPDRADDRERELATVGAGHAAGALAALIGETVRIDVPRLVRTLDDATISPHGPDAPVLALVFELDHSLGDSVALLLPDDVEREIVTRLCRERGGTRGVILSTGSVLEEVGNIVTSHFASAIADLLGSRIVPSLPRVVRERPLTAVRALVARAASAGSPSALVELVSDSRAVRMKIVLAPERTGRALA